MSERWEQALSACLRARYIVQNGLTLAVHGSLSEYENTVIALVDKLSPLHRELLNREPDLLIGVSLGPISGIVAFTAAQHVLFGYPAELPVDVVHGFWVAEIDWEKPEEDIVQCCECGLSVPKAHSACALCGGQVATAGYSIRRSLTAFQN